MMDLYIQKEAKKEFKEWTHEGLSFLLQQEHFREMAIIALSKFLLLNKSVEFTYNNLYYEVFESADSGYIVNLYSSNEKDDEGEYMEEFIVDGGLCTGSAKDAIEFMLSKEETASKAKMLY